MYKGKRDSHVSIRVPQEYCVLVTLLSGTFVEILFPDAQWADTQWSSWVVRPEQVCYDRFYPDKFNIIENINAGTDIVISTKFVNTLGQRIIIPESTITIDPDELVRIYNEICIRI